MSKTLLLAGMQWLKYRKGCDIVVTEYGTHFPADLYGVCIHWETMKPFSTYEIEVKVSVSDFKRDFTHKTKKHHGYSVGKGPHYFWFLVPEQIKDACLKVLEDKNQRYGLLCFDSQETDLTMMWARIYSAKKAQRLNREEPKIALGLIVRRMFTSYLDRISIDQLSGASFGLNQDTRVNDSNKSPSDVSDISDAVD